MTMGAFPRGSTTGTQTEYPTASTSADRPATTRTTGVGTAIAVTGTVPSTASWTGRRIASTAVRRRGPPPTIRQRGTTTKTVTQGIRRRLARIVTDEPNKVQRRRRNRDPDPGHRPRRAAHPADLHPGPGLEAAPARPAVRHPGRPVRRARRNHAGSQPVTSTNQLSTPKIGGRWQSALGTFHVGRRILR